MSAPTHGKALLSGPARAAGPIQSFEQQGLRALRCAADGNSP